jgi:hypothetical protein
MDTSFTLKAGAVLLFALFATSAAGQRMDSYVAPALGSTFIYQSMDSGSYGSGQGEAPNSVVEFTLEGRRLVSYVSGDLHFLTLPTGGLVGFASKDGKLILSWDPPLDFAYPLEVGKTWTRQHQMTIHGQNRTVPYQVTGTVEAVEDLAVPGGTFQAYRVRTVDSAGNTNLEWLNPELGIFVKRVMERSDQHAQGPGRRELVLKSHDIRKP